MSPESFDLTRRKSSYEVMISLQRIRFPFELLGRTLFRPVGFHHVVSNLFFPPRFAATFRRLLSLTCRFSNMPLSKPFHDRPLPPIRCRFGAPFRSPVLTSLQRKDF